MNYCFIEVDGLSDLYLVKANGCDPIYKCDIEVTNLKGFNESINKDGFIMLL